MMYQVTYKKPKKRGVYSNQTATFIKIEDAFFWEELMKKQGCKESRILVL